MILIIVTHVVSVLSLIKKQSLRLSQMASLMMKKHKLKMVLNITGKVHQQLTQSFPLKENSGVKLVQNDFYLVAHAFAVLLGRG